MKTNVSGHVRWPLLTGIGVATLVAGLTILFAPTSLYRLVTSVVVVDDPLEPADLIYVLNGRIEPRVEHVARLYRMGLAPVILLPQTREMARRPDRPLSELIASEIVSRGVPRDAVGILPFDGGVVDTRDEARALRQHLARCPVRKVIVVTMDYHTGRARRTVKQELRGLGVEVAMAAASDPGWITREDWWESNEGRRIYLGELVKQAGVLVQGMTPRS